MYTPTILTAPYPTRWHLIWLFVNYDSRRPLLSGSDSKDQDDKPIRHESPGVTKVRSGLIGGTPPGVETDSGKLLEQLKQN